MTDRDIHPWTSELAHPLPPSTTGISSTGSSEQLREAASAGSVEGISSSRTVYPILFDRNDRLYQGFPVTSIEAISRSRLVWAPTDCEHRAASDPVSYLTFSIFQVGGDYFLLHPLDPVRTTLTVFSTRRLPSCRRFRYSSFPFSCLLAPICHWTLAVMTRTMELYADEQCKGPRRLICISKKSQIIPHQTPPWGPDTVSP